MTIYTPNDAFTDADIYDLSDLVKGGSDGDANVPLKALADRTLYLFNRLGGYKDVKIITGDYSYDAVNDLFKMMSFTINANRTFTLPDVTALRTGSVIDINLKTVGIKALTVLCSGGQEIYDGNLDVVAMYMHDAERLRLVAASNTSGATGDHWEIGAGSDGNYRTAGMDFYCRKLLRNSVIAQGQLVNRQDMPRLWAFANSLPDTINDGTWLININYQGFFTTGNTVSTFRLPDERGQFTRALDLSRGIDLSRITNAPGGYESDAILSHSHNFQSGGDTFIDDVANGYVKGRQNADGRVETHSVTSTGGGENLVKNLGKYPLVLY